MSLPRYRTAEPSKEYGRSIVYDVPAGRVVASVDWMEAAKGMHIQIAKSLNLSDQLADALAAILAAYDQPIRGDAHADQMADSIFDAIEITGAREVLAAYKGN